jgi:two-component system, NarL family, nitrate/nitrite response regulator NarL
VIRVALLGDVRLNREGLAALLRRDGRLQIAAESSTADGLPGQGDSVDVVVVDTATHDGPLSMRAVVSTVQAPIVVLGAPDEERNVIALAELGVVGFVEREASLDELVAAVVSAAAGEASFPPRIATTLLRRVSSVAEQRVPADVSSLTVREREIVQLIAESLSNKEIATTLCIEVATVKNHVHNVLEKLQVSRRSDAVARLRLIEGGGSAPAAEPVSATRTTTRSRAG